MAAAAWLKRSPLPRLVLVVLAGVVGVAAGVVVARHGQGHDFPFIAAGLAGACVLVSLAYALDPVWLISIGIGASIFSGDAGYLHTHVPIDRAILLVGLASLAWRAITEKALKDIEVRRIHWCMLLLLLYTIVSMVLSGNLDNHAGVYSLVDQFGVFPFVLFWVGPVVYSTPRKRRILLGTLTVVGAYLSVNAVFEVLGPHSLVFPSFIEDPSLGVNFGRAQGPFLESGADGLSMFVAMVAAATLFPEAGSRVRTLLMIIIGLCLLGVILSETRQVWVGAGAGALVSMAITPSLRRYIPTLILLVALIVGIVLISDASLRAELGSRTSDAKSVWDRINSDAAALRMIEQRPLLGFGWGSFSSVGQNFYHVAPTIPLSGVGEVHNVSLSVAAELGVVAYAVWLGLIITAGAGAVRFGATPESRRWRTATIAIMLAWFVQSNFEPLTYAFDNYLVWLFAGVTYTLVRTQPPAARAAPAATWLMPTVGQAA